MGKIDKVNQKILNCKYCKNLALGKIVPGEGASLLQIIIIGEAPGRQEALSGRPFTGNAGKILEKLMSGIGLERKHVFLTSAVKYLPKNKTPGNEDIVHGRKHLTEQLNVLTPKLAILLGKISGKAILQRSVEIKQEHGKVFSVKKLLCFLTYHPASVLYNPKIMPQLETDFQKIKKILQELNLLPV